MKLKTKIAMLLILLCAATTSLFADATLYNSDSQDYKILLNASESCFSGTHTTSVHNTRESVPAGWACLNEQGPGVKLEDGKSYVIKNGTIQPE